MLFKRCFILLFILLARFSFIHAAVFYVAPDGLDSNPGNMDQPFATIQRAQQFVNAGDTVFIRGGDYHITESDISRVERNLFACISFIDKSGLPDKRIHYWAYPGEIPVFDFSEVMPADQRVVGIYVTAEWIHFRGLEMTGVQVTIKTHTESYCIYSYGSNNIYEQIMMHDNQGTGIRHWKGGNNLFLNCDAWQNHDYTSEDGRGGNTDGFGCHPDDGDTNNIFMGCRSWFNSDDGFDVIGAAEPVIFENCWAFYNGYSTGFSSLGDGNGFKAGGHAGTAVENLPVPIPRHTIRFCLAVRNKANGFYANHHIGGSNWYNNSSYRNSTNYNMLNRLADNITDVPGYDHYMRNNLGYKGNSNIRNVDFEKCDISHNSFDLQMNITDNDFLSLDEALLTEPRQPDGSLPENDFMRPNPLSALIDKGEDIGYAFAGPAPDLGAFEQDSTAMTSLSFTKSDELNIYPNPARNYLQINNVNCQQIMITNLFGRVLSCHIHENKIDVSTLDNGIYFLIILTEDNQTLTNKFIK